MHNLPTNDEINIIKKIFNKPLNEGIVSTQMSLKDAPEVKGLQWKGTKTPPNKIKSAFISQKEFIKQPSEIPQLPGETTLTTTKQLPGEQKLLPAPQKALPAAQKALPAPKQTSPVRIPPTPPQIPGGSVPMNLLKGTASGLISTGIGLAADELLQKPAEEVVKFFGVKHPEDVAGSARLLKAPLVGAAAGSPYGLPGVAMGAALSTGMAAGQEISDVILPPEKSEEEENEEARRMLLSQGPKPISQQMIKTGIDQLASKFQSQVPQAEIKASQPETKTPKIGSSEFMNLSAAERSKIYDQELAASKTRKAEAEAELEGHKAQLQKAIQTKTVAQADIAAGRQRMETEVQAEKKAAEERVSKAQEQMKTSSIDELMAASDKRAEELEAWRTQRAKEGASWAQTPRKPLAQIRAEAQTKAKEDVMKTIQDIVNTSSPVPISQPKSSASVSQTKSWEEMTPQERFQRGEQIRAERDVPEMEAKATAVTTGKPGSRERQAAMDRYRAQQSGTILPAELRRPKPSVPSDSVYRSQPAASVSNVSSKDIRPVKTKAKETAKTATKTAMETAGGIVKGAFEGMKNILGIKENYYNILSERLKNLQEAKQEQRAEARAKSMGFNLPMGHPRSRGGVNVAAIKPERLGPHLQSIVSAGAGERTYTGETEETTKETPKQPSWGEKLKPHIITLMGAAQEHKIELSKEEAVSNSADRKRLLAQYKPGSDVHKAAQAVDEIMKTVRRD